MVELRVMMAAAAVFAAAPVGAQTVLDGDTMRYNGVVVHLWGVDAPEKGQLCGDGWPAGQMAETYLAGLVKDRKVTCDLKDKEATTSGPTFALCKVDGQDLSAAMAQGGMAWAYLAQTKDYSVPEANAMIAVSGVHAHDCMKAWEWRAKRLKQRGG
jgi:endonuclease YncB( thermonuclease family)